MKNCWKPIKGMLLEGTWCDGYTTLIGHGKTVCDVETLSRYDGEPHDAIIYGDDDGFVIKTIYGNWLVLVDKDDLAGTVDIINRLVTEAITVSS